MHNHSKGRELITQRKSQAEAELMRRSEVEPHGLNGTKNSPS